MGVFAGASPLLTITLCTAAGRVLLRDAPGWHVDVTEESWSGPGTQVRLRATWHSPTPIQAGLVVHLRLGGPTPRRLLIPAVFYDDNGPGSRTTRYPHPGPLNAAAFTAPGWDFAAARLPCPACFVWDDGGLSWIAVAPHGAGVGFSRGPDGIEGRVHLPGIEGPFAYDRTDETPRAPLASVAPGGVLDLTVWYGSNPTNDPSAFAPIQRALQRAWGGATARPVAQTTAQAAATAAAEGLLCWHYRPDLGQGVLVEAVSFDRTQVRDEMHVAWISGTPAAYALLRHGRSHSDAAAAEAGRAVLDTVAEGLAPCGAFWGCWTPRGWRAGWNGDPQTLHARTLAEATLFLVRALTLEPDHPRWAAAARSNLDFCLRAQDAQGHPGSYYHAHTGTVLDRRGTAGLLWAAALAESAALFDVPAYQEAALRVGTAYAPAIREGRLLGAPEDIGLCPSSEDGYNALIAMMALYRATGDPAWRDLARRAADWLLTFRWSYDVRFPLDSPLARRGFRTQGADAASPSNHHLHLYGLICQGELRALSIALADPWYADRATDHLACFLGEVVQMDGQWGGPERRGMMAEQWYTANWSREGRAGEMAPVSHAWCLGLLLLAADEWLEDHYAKTETVPGAERRPPGPRRIGSSRTPGPGTLRSPAAPAFIPDRPHPVRLLPGFYQVGGGFLSHPRDASSYLLLDEATGAGILVDCGSHTGLPALRANIAQVADLRQVQLVIGTHCHWDHVEAFGHLRDEMPARFALHETEATAVTHGDPDLTCAGFLYNETFHPFPVDLLLKGGEHFALGPFELDILHLPGHSPGCIGVKMRYRPTGQTVLIPGDAVQGGFGRKIHSNVPAWKRSIRRLMQEQLDYIVPTHMPGGAQTALLADVPNRLARVYSELQTDFHAFMDHQRT